TLIATTTWLTRLESLIPAIRIAVRTRTRMPAGRLTAPSSALASEAGNSNGVPSSTEMRYADQPEDTAAAPTMNSRIRSHPMIQATSSPSVAYEKVYALPATGTVEANSA